VVLTTPVVRAVKQQVPGAQVHYITKEVFRCIVAHNPYIDKLITIHYDLREALAELRSEKYDLVIDLHKNLRTFRLKRLLGVKSISFDKLNMQKFLAVNLKLLHLLPPKHIVDRYFESLASINVVNDGKGLDYFTGPGDEVNVQELFFKGKESSYIALVIGGSYYTKKIPLNKLIEICKTTVLPLVILGGKHDKPVADQLKKMFPLLINGSGQFSINQSASIIRQAGWVITSDTGMMHIAAAYRKKMISAWGNTIPEFGMYPFHSAPGSRLLEVKNLSCRPCSKLGYGRCPLGHFKCMQEIDYSFVSELE
jgi:ADP-heptose:LPS heptosyltransferase